jgi:hypothetical protein
MMMNYQNKKMNTTNNYKSFRKVHCKSMNKIQVMKKKMVKNKKKTTLKMH